MMIICISSNKIICSLLLCRFLTEKIKLWILIDKKINGLSSFPPKFRKLFLYEIVLKWSKNVSPVFLSKYLPVFCLFFQVYDVFSLETFENCCCKEKGWKKSRTNIGEICWFKYWTCNLRHKRKIRFWYLEFP